MMQAFAPLRTAQDPAVQEPGQTQAFVSPAAVYRLPLWSQMRGGVLQRTVEAAAETAGTAAPTAERATGPACPEDVGGALGAVQSEALKRLGDVVDHMADYDGAEPAVTGQLLERYFKRSSKRFARRIRRILRNVHRRAARTHYRCVVAPAKPCDEEGDRAFVVPCLGSLVPVTVCAPAFFEDSPLEQEKTLIHEWCHQYACKGDVAYDYEEEFGDLVTRRALFNADSFAEFVGAYYLAI